jgi:hypothetical protein
MDLNVYYQNTRGLNTKTHEVYRKVINNNHSIIALTETWLKPGVFSRELFDDRYSVFRRDRSSQTSSKATGGGVCIAVLNSIAYTIIHNDSWQCEEVEDLWVTIKPKQENENTIHINCAYLPGDMDKQKFENFTNQLSIIVNSHPDDSFFIMGDYNDPDFDPCEPSTPSNKTFYLRELMEVCNLEQFNSCRSNLSPFNLLDLIFSNRFIKVEICDFSLSTVDDYHPPLKFSICTKIPHESETASKYRNYKKVSWSLLIAVLMTINWPLVFLNARNVDEKLQRFYNVIVYYLDKFAPEITPRKFNHPRWLSRETVKLKGKKRIYHQKWKWTKDKADYDAFSFYRKKSDESEELDYENYNRDAEIDIKENPKAFWKHVNSRKDTGAGVADYITLDDKVAYTKSDATELFALQFSRVYGNISSTDTNNIDQVQRSVDSWSSMFIPMSTIYDKLSSLDVSKAPGPDKIPPLFFRKCATALTFPLFIIFNDSLRKGCFPSFWKLAHVIPIHKDGSTHDAKNYRPISKLSIPAKVLDNIIADEIFERFKNVIIPQQHGFFKKRSTVTNLADYTEKLQRVLDTKGQTDVVYTDFSKAFDKVDHLVLINKLRSLGIHGVMLEWFRSYITGRLQRVQIGEFLSRPINVTSSVVQGSHCGPLLFSLFINDISEAMDGVDFCVYADDLKIFKSIDNLADINTLQTCLDRLSDYVNINRLSLNLKKCFVVSFTRRTTKFISNRYQISDVELQRKETMRDLGVYYDSKLSFNDHVDLICGKARRMLGFVMRAGKYFKDPRTFTTLYNSLVRSNLEYASVIWNPHTANLKTKLERVQRKFLRFVATKCFKLDPEQINYSEIEAQLKLDTLELRRIFADVKFTVKSFNGEIDGQTFLHNFKFSVPNSTRSSNVFHPIASLTDSGNHSVFNRLMKTYNRNYKSTAPLHVRPSDHMLKCNAREKYTLP